MMQRMLASRPFTLSDLKPEVSRLTKDHLDWATFVFVADKLKNAKACREHETEYYLAHQILRYFLGDEWTEKAIFDHNPGTTRHFRKGRIFLKSDSPGTEENVKHQDRVIKLAECLYNLQQIPGIAQRIALLEKDSLEAVYSEFECARMMSHPSLQLRFIVPTSSSQSDYDAEITTPANNTICCEIKAKDESTELKEKSIANTLESARRQLPKGRPGLVWIRIPEQWATQVGAKAIVDAAVDSALRKSERLVAVIAAFQLWQSDGTGMLTQSRFTVALNRRSSYYSNDIEEAIELLGAVENKEWLHLRNYISSRFSEFVRFVESKLPIAGEAPDQRHDSPTPLDQDE